jgi:hypothetical protein
LTCCNNPLIFPSWTHKEEPEDDIGGETDAVSLLEAESRMLRVVIIFGKKTLHIGRQAKNSQTQVNGSGMAVQFYAIIILR